MYVWILTEQNPKALHNDKTVQEKFVPSMFPSMKKVSWVSSRLTLKTSLQTFVKLFPLTFNCK